MITTEIIRKMIHGAYVYSDGELLGRISVDSPNGHNSLSDDYVFLCSDNEKISGTRPKTYRFGFRYGWCIHRVSDTLTYYVNQEIEAHNITSQDILCKTLIDSINAPAILSTDITIKLESSLTLYDIC